MKLFAYNSEGALQYPCDICSDSSICPEMPRRNRFAFEHRERIVRAFEDINEDYLLFTSETIEG